MGKNKLVRIEKKCKSYTVTLLTVTSLTGLLPPQGFRPEAKSRGGTLVARTYIKDSTYSTNMQSVYRKNLDLLEQGPRGIGR